MTYGPPHGTWWCGRTGGRVIADTRAPLALYESGFAPRWYVPREDVATEQLRPAKGQTFCPYKGVCSYYAVDGSPRSVWSYLDAYSEVGRISGYLSFEPDRVEVYLDDVRLHLEPGQTVVPHGVDRALISTNSTAPTTGTRDSGRTAADKVLALSGEGRISM